MKGLSHKRLLEVLDYNKDTGDFFRKGKKVGAKNKAGYLVICIDYKLHYAHRLAWFYLYKECPRYIDHINLVKGDNRIYNLRPATKAQNGANSVGYNPASGFKGVYYQSNTLKWRVKIAGINVGYFDTKEEASAAYFSKAKELYGEFARVA